MTSGTITREQFEVRQIKDKRALSAQKKQVLICAGTGCIAGGSLDIYDYLKEACAKRGPAPRGRRSGGPRQGQRAPSEKERLPRLL